MDLLLCLSLALARLAQWAYNPKLSQLTSECQEVLDRLDLSYSLACALVTLNGITYHALRLDIHSHAMIRSLTRGGLVGDALSGYQDQITEPLQDIRNDLLFPVCRRISILTVRSCGMSCLGGCFLGANERHMRSMPGGKPPVDEDENESHVPIRFEATAC